MSTVEGWHTLQDGTKLYTKTWKTESPPVARLAFVHGFSDHCNMYGSFFPTLASRGIEVLGFDQRGWGRTFQSPAERGRTGPTALVLEDISAFLKSITPSDVPLFLMGHSMGGAQVLTYMATGPSSLLRQIRGFLVEAPFVAFAPKQRPNKLTEVIGRLAGKVLPHHHMYAPLDIQLLSRDPEVQQRVKADELCHDTGTLQGLAGMIDRARNLENGKVVPGKGVGEGGVTRLWISHGTEDQVCGYDASKDLAERWEKVVDDLEWKAYEGWYHKLHDEPGEDRVTFANDVADWVLARATTTDGPAQKSKL